jgi:hypothetical protein
MLIKLLLVDNFLLILAGLSQHHLHQMIQLTFRRGLPVFLHSHLFKHLPEFMLSENSFAITIILVEDLVQRQP